MVPRVGDETRIPGRDWNLCKWLLFRILDRSFRRHRPRHKSTKRTLISRLLDYDTLSQIHQTGVIVVHPSEDHVCLIGCVRPYDIPPKDRLALPPLLIA